MVDHVSKMRLASDGRMFFPVSANQFSLSGSVDRGFLLLSLTACIASNAPPRRCSFFREDRRTSSGSMLLGAGVFHSESRLFLGTIGSGRFIASGKLNRELWSSRASVFISGAVNSDFGRGGSYLCGEVYRSALSMKGEGWSL